VEPIQNNGFNINYIKLVSIWMEVGSNHKKQMFSLNSLQLLIDEKFLNETSNIMYIKLVSLG